MTLQRKPNHHNKSPLRSSNCSKFLSVLLLWKLSDPILFIGNLLVKVVGNAVFVKEPIITSHNIKSSRIITRSAEIFEILFISHWWELVFWKYLVNFIKLTFHIDTLFYGFWPTIAFPKLSTTYYFKTAAASLTYPDPKFHSHLINRGLSTIIITFYTQFT